MLPNELSVMLASLQRRELKENRRLGPGEKEERGRIPVQVCPTPKPLSLFHTTPRYFTTQDLSNREKGDFFKVTKLFHSLDQKMHRYLVSLRSSQGH